MNFLSWFARIEFAKLGYSKFLPKVVQVFNNPWNMLRMFNKSSNPILLGRKKKQNAYLLLPCKLEIRSCYPHKREASEKSISLYVSEKIVVGCYSFLKCFKIPLTTLITGKLKSTTAYYDSHSYIPIAYPILEWPETEHI